MRPLDIPHVFEPALGHAHGALPPLLITIIIIDGLDILGRDLCPRGRQPIEQAVEHDDPGDGQVDILAQQEVLPRASDGRPCQVREAVPVGGVRADLAVVQLQWGPRGPAFRAGELEGRGRVVGEGGALGEGAGFVAFAIGEQFAEGVFDEGGRAHDDGGCGVGDGWMGLFFVWVGEGMDLSVKEAGEDHGAIVLSARGGGV